MIRIRSILLILIAISCVSSAWGQFYSSGRGRTSIKWSQVDSTHYRIVYPARYEVPAARMAHLLDTVYPYIGRGINFKIRKVPIILHTENVLSNGYVTWAPKREELIMIPSMDNYALLWDKSLPIHEWRHIAQISALRRGITRIASWLIGEGGVGLGVLFFPRWIMEGDATIAETQFAEYGRGLQPNFTVEYRAMFADGQKNFSRLDRWLCGSYKRHYPDIYKFGYQTLSAAEQYLGADYFGQMIAYSGRWPIFIMPADIYLSHKHKTSFKKIAKRAFAELDSLWAPYANVKENFSLSILPNKRTYATYSYPTQIGDGQVVVIKGDYDTPTRLVDLYSGRRLKSMGYVTSRPMAHDGKIYFTEYVPHPIFEQTNFSVIRALDPASGRIKTFDRRGRHYFITPIDNGFASVSIDDQSRSVIQYFDPQMRPTRQHHFTSTQTTLQGLAYDSLTHTLAFIALDKRGMWLGTIDSLQVKELTRPNVITISDLTANEGKLYFSSIESGKNEIHSFDLQTNSETRLTQSRFSSSMPAASGDSLHFTTYRAEGIIPAVMALTTSPIDTVAWNRLPKNLLNAKRPKWDVPKVDSLDFQAAALKDTASMKKRRTNRFKEPFAIHSWAPAAVDADFLMEDRPLNIAFGVTAFFQTTLSKLAGFLTYGWLNQTNWLKGRVHYTGLPLNISIGAEYGGGYQSVYTASNVQLPDHRELYLSADVTLSLPLNLSIGGFSQLLQPSFSVSYDNGLLYDFAQSTYRQGGFARYGASLWWSSYRNKAHRNINPRWGYALRANVSGSFDRNFGTLYSLFVKGYLPGVAKNHSVSLTAAAQYQQTATYNYSSKAFYLTGVTDPYIARSYAAAQLNYALPIACPDWGWEGVIYLSRIRANLFGGYSTGQYLTNVEGRYTTVDHYTYGVDLSLDFTLLRAYAQSMTFTFAAPSDKGFYFGFSYGFGLF